MVRFLQLLGGARGVRATDGEEVGPLLDEQRAYDRALAADYLDQGLDLPGGDEVTDALDAFQPNGSVLELACGPGVWTGQLLRHASEVTAVDASPEMLAIAAARVGDERVRFIEADLSTGKPDRRYDVVFFGFWLSHVPAERFASFWSLVADCLEPEGRVFFADDGCDNSAGTSRSPRQPGPSTGGQEAQASAPHERPRRPNCADASPWGQGTRPRR
jgi:SAM-dependent methyltransferase